MCCNTFLSAVVNAVQGVASRLVASLYALVAAESAEEDTGASEQEAGERAASEEGAVARAALARTSLADALSGLELASFVTVLLSPTHPSMVKVAVLVRSYLATISP